MRYKIHYVCYKDVAVWQEKFIDVLQWLEAR